MRNPFVKNVANDIGLWALWATRNKKGRYNFHYRKVRPFSVVLKTEMFLDCSAFVAWCYRQAGAPDPYRMGYAGVGNTEWLLAKGQHIPVSKVRPGDVVVYAEGHKLSEQHAAIIVAKGTDPLTVSMGQEGDPSLVRVSQDGRTPTYLRFDTSLRWKPTPFPAP